MKLYSKVDRLEKGLRKMLLKRRYLFSEKDKKHLKKVICFLKDLDDFEKRKPPLIEKVVFRIIQFILKIM